MRKTQMSPKKDWILKEFCFHVVHECRPKTRLLSFDNGRKNCQERLRQAAVGSKAKVLNYFIADDSLRLIVSGSSDQVTEIMRRATSATASDYAQRTCIEGPFWKGRYNSVLVQKGAHLLRACLLMDRTMVDREVCLYPGEWNFSGYRELTGIRKRYRIIDAEATARITGLENEECLRQWYTNDSEGRRFIEGAKPHRIIEALAVGDRMALEKIGECFPRRTRNKCEIDIIAPNSQNPTYGLFAPNKTKRSFTRSIKKE
jgi:hypothetical protein